MQIDIKTLALVIAFGNLIFGLLVSLYNATSNAFNPSLSMYRWAKLVGSIGMFLLIFRANLPQLLSFNIAHIFLFSSWALELCAYCIFLQRLFWQKLIFVSTIFAITLFQLISYFEAPYSIAFSTFFGGCIYSGMSIVFLLNRSNHVWILRFLGVFDFIAAVVFFLRTAERFSTLHYVPSFSPTTANAVLYGMGFFAMMANGFGFLLLVKQEDEKRLNQAFAELEIAEADQRQMLAMATHEFRIPLSVIDSSAQLLSITVELDEKGQKLVKRIRRGVKRLVYFLDNCLTEDRLDNRKLVLHPERIDLAKLAKWGKENAAFISTTHSIDIELAPNLPILEGDKHLLQVLLINLLSNAIKFSTPQSEIKLQIQVQEKNILLSVSDQGQGIPEDELPLISQKYMRGRGAGSISGAGLGLSLVDKIVKLHNGHWHISSDLNKGTCVKIYLLCNQKFIE